jgi:hypothetical protein
MSYHKAVWSSGVGAVASFSSASRMNGGGSGGTSSTRVTSEPTRFGTVVGKAAPSSFSKIPTGVPHCPVRGRWVPCAWNAVGARCLLFVSPGKRAWSRCRPPTASQPAKPSLSTPKPSGPVIVHPAGSSGSAVSPGPSGSGGASSSYGGGGGGGGTTSGASTSYGGGDGGWPSTWASEETIAEGGPTGPPLEIPPEIAAPAAPSTTTKKPMSTAVKVGLAAAAGLAIMTMFAK